MNIVNYERTYEIYSVILIGQDKSHFTIHCNASNSSRRQGS